MDNSNNNQNKLIVLVAVALIGAAAGQHLLKPAAPPAQQMGPWGPSYAMQQPPMGYGPMGYAQPPYAGHPSYGQSMQLTPAQPLPGIGLQSNEQQSSVRSRDHANNRELDDAPDGVQHEQPSRTTPTTSPHRTRRSAVQASDRVVQVNEERTELLIAAVPSPVVFAQSAVAAVPAGLKAPRLISIQDGDTTWAGDQLGDVLLKTKTIGLTIGIDAAASSTDPLELVASWNGGTPQIIEVVSAANIAAGIASHVIVSVPGAPVISGRATLQVGFRDVGVLTPPASYSTMIAVRFPADTLTEPSEIKVSSTKLRASADPGAGVHNVYDGFLHLEGSASVGSSIRFSFERKLSDGKFQMAHANLAVVPVVSTVGSGKWSADLKLPDLGPAFPEGRVHVVAESSSPQSHHFATNSILTRRVARSNVNIKIGLGDIEQGESKPAKLVTPGFANDAHLKFPVTTSGEASDAVLVLFEEGSNNVLSTLDYSVGTPVLLWTADQDAVFNLRVEAHQGAGLISKANPLRVSLRQSGPFPTGVSPTNLSQTPGQDLIRIAFSRTNLLNFTSIAAADFELTNLGDSKKTVAARTVNPIPSENSIDVLFESIPEGAYQLAVGKKLDDIQDLHGNNLAPVSGVALYTFGIIKPVGSQLSSAPTVGLSNLTGPYVPYQEYTDPRKSQTGFNPSDKVVTRVARLYYYRDAHRVVQLINRGARSYNRQAVDMQQQLADNARQQAESATNERRAAEQKALQSAQRARASETALTQFQQALVTARQQLATAEADLVRHQAANETLRDNQEDATAERIALETVDKTTLTPGELKDLPKNIKEAKQKELAASRKVEASDQVKTQKQSAVTAAQSQVTNSENHVNHLLAEIQNARNDESQQRETLDRRQFEEDSKHKDLFRREVAAAHEDPDTYAPGVPTSQDPIEQVSLSVIGEGLIQLRGPLKGVNLARTLINQIDAPVGQVKVAIHTVQVNGEHGKRMEPVIGRIQRYIDHSRFLTTQSGQMLRNSVTLVASRRADQAMLFCEVASQAERDQKYIEAFFGREFLDELKTLDSEFLHTGNKLLSLHSMDSTSLANALFLLSLAKNDVRHEILGEFERMVTCNLPQDEQEYFIASNEKYKFGPMFHKQKFQFLGHNAKFVSLKGFFNSDVAGSDTMTPMQREFIRLAQIFKSRLVTEIELQQRVMERSLIEDRISDYKSEQLEAAQKEKQAKASLDQVKDTLSRNRIALLEPASKIEALARAVQLGASECVALADRYSKSTTTLLANAKAQFGGQPLSNLDLNEADEDLKSFWKFQGVQLANTKTTTVEEDLSLLRTPTIRIRRDPEPIRGIESTPIQAQIGARTTAVTVFKSDRKSGLGVDLDEATAKIARQQAANAISYAKQLLRELSSFRLEEEHQRNHDNAVRLFNVAERAFASDVETVEAMATLSHGFLILTKLAEHVRDESSASVTTMRMLIEKISSPDPNVREAYVLWERFKLRVAPYLAGEFLVVAQDLFPKVDSTFRDLATQQLKTDLELKRFESSRRPLDHKKYMDMLIDDVEDKFIELMEGTRAHTANIDNYLSRLGQALEDDFNTQFYHPAFKGIREASRFWDVNMGQIETTTILTNNRMFAKVSPQATMEFDLPKRDILIKEAFQSAQAAYQDYGALLGDPTFLALTKMHRGQAASAIFSGDGSTPSTRNVLPGLPSMTDEKMVAQNRAVAPDFPSALESLIPDPAIYKFETGTGYEIRPVIQPDGQAVVFHFNYMYTTNVREPVRADEKHLGRVKRHFIDTDVQTGNYEMREVSKYQVALKASRTSRGVPLLEDIPGAGILFRPLPNQESSIQENIILAQSVIFPTLFDLMGLRWAPAVADLDSLRLQEADFVTRSRQRGLKERVFDHSSQQVDEFLRIPESERRPDLYRSQETTPYVHPNGYSGPGLNLKDGHLREGYDAERVRPETHYTPGASREGAVPRRPFSEDGPREGVLQEEPVILPPGEGFDDGIPPQPMLYPSAPTSSRAAPSSSRVSNAATNSAVQQQSYRTVSPTTPTASGAKAVPAVNAPRGSRPVPKGAGSPPGLLPGVSPPPLRLPAPDEVKPSASSTKGLSPQIVQVSGTDSTKLEPAPVVPAKKKLAVPALWPKKP